MRLICPSCGAISSAETWRNEVTVRQFIGVLDRLPARVRDLALPYLGLFRRAGGRDGEGAAGGSRGMAWPRAMRILSDLAALVDPGTIHWDGCEVRPCHPQVWAMALEAVLDRRPKALENHNYLRRVAWEMAGHLASHQERERESQRRQSTRREDTVEQPDTSPNESSLHVNEQPMSREQWADLKNALGKIGQH